MRHFAARNDFIAILCEFSKLYEPQQQFPYCISCITLIARSDIGAQEYYPLLGDAVVFHAWYS